MGRQWAAIFAAGGMGVVSWQAAGEDRISLRERVGPVGDGTRRRRPMFAARCAARCALAAAGIVVESVNEDRSLKHRIFADLEALAPADIRDQQFSVFVSRIAME